MCLEICAGIPVRVTLFSENDFVTTAFAPIVILLPRLMLPRTFAPIPKSQLSPITGAFSGKDTPLFPIQFSPCKLKLFPICAFS